MDDPAIVELYLARDESAVRHTAERYGAALRALADRILRDPSSAEECENDTYLEAWNRIPPHEPRSYLFAFLGRITRHLAIDRARAAAAHKRSALLCELTQELEQCLPGADDVQRTLEAAELADTIRRFLSHCSADQRRVFLRRYWYFDSIADIAAQTGFSKSKVKTTLFRLRERLRAELEQEGYTI